MANTNASQSDHNQETLTKPSPAEQQHDSWQFLQDLDPEIFASYITYEHPQVIALLISMLEDSASASQVMLNLPPHLQADIASRIIHMGPVARGVQVEIADVVAEEMKTASAVKKIGGQETMRKIIQAGGKEAYQGVLETIEKNDPTLAQSLKTSLDK